MVIAAAEQSGNHKQAAARRKKLTLLDNEWLLGNLTAKEAINSAADEYSIGHAVRRAGFIDGAEWMQQQIKSCKDGQK